MGIGCGGTPAELNRKAYRMLFVVRIFYFFIADRDDLIGHLPPDLLGLYVQVKKVIAVTDPCGKTYIALLIQRNVSLIAPKETSREAVLPHP